MKRKKVNGVSFGRILLVYLALYLLCLPYIFANERVEITTSDLMKLKTNLTELKTQLETQKGLTQELENQLTSASDALMSAKESLTEFKKSTDKELNKRLLVGVSIGVGATALITLITLIATGIIGGNK